MIDARCHLRFRKEREALVGCAARAAALSPCPGSADLYICPVLSCKRHSCGVRGALGSRRGGGEEQHKVAVHLLADHHDIMCVCVCVCVCAASMQT